MEMQQLDARTQIKVVAFIRWLQKLSDAFNFLPKVNKSNKTEKSFIVIGRREGRKRYYKQGSSHSSNIL